MVCGVTRGKGVSIPGAASAGAKLKSELRLINHDFFIKSNKSDILH